MKILFCSVPFRPSIGGIETVSEILAEGFQRAGHELVLATQTPGPGAGHDGFPIERRPSSSRLYALVGWSDLVFHNNISLRMAWPLLALRRPWVIAHHTWIPRCGPGALAGRFKRVLLNRAHNIAVSNAMAGSLPVPATVVPNPYADDVFKPAPGTAAPRERELVYVGRLVSDKGVHVLIDALAVLKRQGHRPRLTVVGQGPEEPRLREQALRCEVEAQLDFCGARGGEELAALLRQHQVLVVPSVWEEPFGVVVLEAMACGCVPVVARSGGLPDAVGHCGEAFDKGDAADLARTLRRLLRDAASLTRYRAAAAAHLERHSRTRVAEQYLQVIEHAHRTHHRHRTAPRR